MTIKLSQDTLAKLPAGIAVPKYDRAKLSAGIVHIGVGNFHRAHQAVYLDDVFNAGRDHDWAIIGAGVRDTDKLVRDKLGEQNWLTTVVEQEAHASGARVTGAMIDFVEPGNAEATLAALARPEIRIVSLTITEGGYYISPATQHFDATHPDIVADAKSISAPKTVFGLIVAGLKRRRDAGLAPFTVMSCDNIPGNGHVTENAVAGLAELVDPELASWIRAHVAFSEFDGRPNHSGHNRSRAADAARQFRTRDNWPVFCEEFRQWVVEDRFPAGRPAFETVGVTFTKDVAPYEWMKIRILNGGHAAIAYPAALLDIHFVHEAMEDAQIAAFLEKLTKIEIMPTVPPPPGVVLEEYRALIASPLSRNPKIGGHHHAAMPRRLQPAAEVHPARRGGSAERWPEPGRLGAGLGPLVPLLLWRDREREGDRAERSELGPHSGGCEKARGEPAAFLEMRDIFGALSDDPRYVAAFSAALSSLWAKGARATLAEFLAA